jgi:hypothetical protein
VSRAPSESAFSQHIAPTLIRIERGRTHHAMRGGPGASLTAVDQAAGHCESQQTRFADHTHTSNCQRVGRCGSAARRDRGGTLTAMRMADADDLVAVDVFNAAQVTGEPVSMTLVRRVVDDLLTHPPECGCGHCEAAAVARLKDVWDIASGWQKAVASITSNRAAR